MENELERDFPWSQSQFQLQNLPPHEELERALAYAEREASESAAAPTDYQVTPVHLLVGLARVPGPAHDTVAQTKEHMERLRAVAREGRARSAEAHDRPTASRSDRVLFVWDPEVLAPDDFAELVTLVGDLVRASGGTGLLRFDQQPIVVTTVVGVEK